jgi:hypothetical protein
MKIAFVFTGIVFFLISCGTPNTGQVQKENDQTAVKKEVAAMQTSTINIDSTVKVIEAENARIEANLKSLTKTSLKTTDLREQIKQKWSVIDFYTENSQIVKIITLPYPQITKRTEEFTFQNGKLILAVIADKGIAEGPDEEKSIDKEYYYVDNKCVKEDNRSNEKETTIRESDSERLLQEALEYLELFPGK